MATADAATTKFGRRSTDVGQQVTGSKRQNGMAFWTIWDDYYSYLPTLSFFSRF